MFIFERMWRTKIKQNTKSVTNDQTLDEVCAIVDDDPINYSRKLIRTLRGNTLDDKIALIFSKSACTMPHDKLTEPRRIYRETGDLELARIALEEMFKQDIKEYKNLSDEQVFDILRNGWGAAGINRDGVIVATKIPSQFHEYFGEDDPIKKRYYYCHCPRVKQELLATCDLDSIYCNCGGGFYKDIWETITGKDVQITVVKNLFDGDDVCQFEIRIS